MIANPPFQRTLLSLFVSGALLGLPEAVRAACETTTDAEGNVSTVDGTCNGYRDNTPINGDFTNIATIEAPDSTANGIRITDSYVENLFNNGLIVGQGENRHGVYLKNSLRGNLENNADINTVRKGIKVKQQDISFGNVINRASVTSYETAIEVQAKGGLMTGDLINEGTLITEDYPQVPDEPEPFETDAQYGMAFIVKDNASASNIINAATGTINARKDGMYYEVQDNASAGNIQNDGSVISHEGSAIFAHVKDNASMGSINNTGSLQGNYSGIRLWADDYGTIGDASNSGTINVTDGGFSGIYIQSQDHSSAGNTTNSGSINFENGFSGIYHFTINDASSGNLTNTGSIVFSGNGFAGLYGFASGDAKVGDLSNSGDITSNTGFSGIYGFSATNSSMGNIDNSGDITISNNAFSGLYGFASGKSVIGDITNSGNIAIGDDSFSGIYAFASDDSEIGNITNNGDISVGTNSLAGLYSHLTKSVIGDITNSGTIMAQSKGVYVLTSESSQQNIDNSGVINAVGQGIQVNAFDSSIGDVTNSGSIVVDGEVEGPSSGISLLLKNNTLAGNIRNTETGSISARSGIFVDTGIDVSNNTISIRNKLPIRNKVGDIENAGTITAANYGIYLNAAQSELGSVKNSGTITSEDEGMHLQGIDTQIQDVINGGSMDAKGHGIHVIADEGSSVRNVINTGSISSEDTGIDISIESNSSIGDVLNSGTISATDYGIRIEADDSSLGSVTNSGSIISEDEGIRLSIDNGTMADFINSGRIEAQDSSTYGVVVWANEANINNVINSGTIISGDEGLRLSGDEGTTFNDVINSGKIEAVDYALRVYADENSSYNQVVNSGQLTSSADHAISVSINDGSSISLIGNSGQISAGEHGLAIDISDSGSAISSVLNEGQITAEEDGIDIDVSDEASINSVANSGTITAQEKGIDIELEDGSSLGSIENTGTITANYHGIEVDADDNVDVNPQSPELPDYATFTLLNTGTVTSNSWHGIMFEGSMNATVGNSGTINGQQNGIGLYRDHGFNNNEGPQVLNISIDNTGTITSNAGQGIFLGQDATGSITNTGTISTTSSGDVFADYGVPVSTSSDPFEGFTQVAYEENEGLPEGTSLYKSDTGNWYAVQREETTEAGTRQVVQYFQSDNTSENIAAFIAEDDDLSVEHNLEQPVFTRLLQESAENGTETFDYMNMRDGLDWLVDGQDVNNAVTPRYIDASGIKLYGTLDGSISNSGTISSTGGSAIGATGGLTGIIINEGSIEGGVLQATPESYTPWPEAETPDFDVPPQPEPRPFPSESLLDDEFQERDIIPGIAVNEGETGPQSGDRVAIDFSRAQTAMNLEQVGSGASILGDVWGQATGQEGNDSATFGFFDAETGISTSGGSMVGDLYGVEDVLVRGGNFTFTGNSYARNGEDNNFTVASTGTLTLGTHTGTQIEGNYTQAGGLITPVGEVNNASGSNTAALTVGDTATISGSMTVNPIWSEFSYARGSQEKYHVVNAQQTDYSGSLANQQTVLFSQNISEENDTDLYLNMTSNDLETEVENASGNALYGDLADDIQDALVAQGAQSDLFQSLLNVADGDELAGIIEDAVTNNDGSEALLAEALQDGVFNNILGRLAETRSGQGGVSFGDETPWHGGVWLKALMVKANQAKQRSGSTTFNGYKSNTKGFTLGYDVDINDQWTAGMAWSYADSKMEVKSSNDETTTKSYQLSLYGNWQSGDWFVDTIVNMGINKNDSSRVTQSNVTYKADFDSKQYGLRVVAGKEFWFNDKDTLLEPQLILNYSHLSTDDYKEKASGQSDISVKSSDYEVLELGAGLRFTHLFELEESILLPEASAKMYYDLKGDTMKQDVNVNILNTSLDYRTTGLETQRMTYQAGVGVSWWLDNSVTLSMNYDRTWRSGFIADSIQAKIRYDF